MENQEKSKADIARENGAKSRGPITEEGKARSSRNALKTGEHAAKLEHFVHPHAVVLGNEDRRAYAQLVEELIAWYAPGHNPIALSIVRDIAIARWEILRLRTCITLNWNLSLIDQSGQPNPYAPELHEYHGLANAAAKLYANRGSVRALHRQISHLQFDIARLERRLKFVKANFNTPEVQPEKRTEAETSANEANKELTSETTENNEPPIYVNETSPAVILGYKTLFPGRKIVIVPPDNVSKNLDIDDDMPTAPRKVA